MSHRFFISETTVTTTTITNGGFSKDGDSFVVPLACQESLSSQRGLSFCRDTIGASAPGCELRDQADKDALRAFALSGSVNVSFYHHAPVHNIHWFTSPRNPLSVHPDPEYSETSPDSKVHGPTWGPSGTDRIQVGPMVTPWSLLFGSSSGRSWMETDFYQYIYTSKTGNSRFRIVTGILGTKCSIHSKKTPKFRVTVFFCEGTIKVKSSVTMLRRN